MAVFFANFWSFRGSGTGYFSFFLALVVLLLLSSFRLEIIFSVVFSGVGWRGGG